MKKIIIAVTIICSYIVTAQSPAHDQVIMKVADYFEAFDNKNTQVMSDLMHPGHFTYINKADYINGMNYAFEIQNSSNFTIKFEPRDFSKLSYSDIIKGNAGDEYVFLNFPDKMKVQVLNPNAPDIKGVNLADAFLEMGMSVFKHNEHEFEVYDQKVIIAIKDKATEGDWKFMFEYNGEDFFNILPQEINEKAIEYLNSITTRQ
ncbi:hypothetical protein AB4865_11490 [Capnocytophaga sp. ARDL2]|uniref:hypothetical protein n=1 Tax=Capnocytophaga sp. ARDL2 TaxID=3238809 RepID=UPI003558282F